MPEFLQDPSVLTKEKLKSELVANNVTLPSGEQRKDVYVQLYLQHLTSQNSGTPDFSSDEEREATPMRGRGRPPGRKATKKTDKPKAEEKDDPDVTELSNEALKEELLKYGMKPGPILSNTRKLYEQRLFKLKEQGLASSALPADTTKADNKQNGNTDSEQYSDNEEEAKVELTFEKREPLRGNPKPQVTMRNRRTEKTEVVAPDPVLFDDADISEVPPISELVVPASNQIFAYAENEHFESSKVVNRVPGSLKHAETLLSVGEISELTRRTPKKQLISEKIVEKNFEERRTERDILKEMFPKEFLTPTGISASCRRPIRGAAGRPLNATDFKTDETYTSKYVSNVSKYTPAVEAKSAKVKPGRSLPAWIKILLCIILVVFCFLVYQAMETNDGIAFSKLFLGITESNKTEN
ncbi:thymopoietin S homeolog isoform X4 [Xenopus laevis]|uniref:Thymopoietin S homeolog isoform X4 n=1 Tax=Xenopus laevis TaxID=8355 RepID=A0A8J0UXM7_XENLA|nr:thymopoietin S homeolog isoform X4 [Xenopus laevis]